MYTYSIIRASQKIKSRKTQATGVPERAPLLGDSVCIMGPSNVLLYISICCCKMAENLHASHLRTPQMPNKNNYVGGENETGPAVLPKLWKRTKNGCDYGESATGLCALAKLPRRDRPAYSSCVLHTRDQARLAAENVEERDASTDAKEEQLSRRRK